MRKRLIFNSVSGTSLFLVNVVCVFLISPVVIRHLGNRDYGIWEILLSVCGYMGLLDLGVSPAIVRYVSKEFTIGDKGSRNQLFNTALFSLVLTGVLACIVTVILSFFPELLLNQSIVDVPYLRILFLIVSATLLIRFTSAFFIAFLMGMQEHFFINSIRIGTAILGTLSTYYCLMRLQGHPIIWIAVILMITGLIEGLLAGIWVLSRSRDIEIGARFVSWSKLMELYSFGIQSALFMSADRIQRQSIPILISHALSVSQVVFYAIPRRLAEYVQGFSVAVGFPAMAYFSTVEAQQKSVRDAWVEVSRWTQVFSLGMPLFTLAFGSKFIALWIGDEYGVQAHWIIIFFSIALFFEGIAPNSARLLIGTGRHGLPAKLLNCLSVVCVLTSYFVAGTAGLPGIAFVIMMSDIAGVVMLLLFACKVVGISVFDHLRLTVIKTIIPLSCLGAILLYFVYFAFPDTLIDMGIKATAASFIYIISIFIFTVSSEEKSLIRAHLPFGNISRSV
jgi:O-antigen/teichoic acid export membrane protein